VFLVNHKTYILNIKKQQAGIRQLHYDYRQMHPGIEDGIHLKMHVSSRSSSIFVLLSYKKDINLNYPVYL
jgi:hypothetical protein